MDELDVLALVIRLAATHLQVELPRPGVDLSLEVLERTVSVRAGVALAEQVEIDTVEDVDAHRGKTLDEVPAEPVSSIRR